MDYLSPVHAIAAFVKYKISRQIQRLVLDIALRQSSVRGAVEYFDKIYCHFAEINQHKQALLKI